MLVVVVAVVGCLIIYSVVVCWLFDCLFVWLAGCLLLLLLVVVVVVAIRQ